ADASTSAAAARHGPHHEAQKATSTGTFESRMMPSKVDKSALIGVATAGRAALQEPQRPVSARWFKATLFFVLQAGQVRIMDWLIRLLDAAGLHFVAALLCASEPFHLRGCNSSPIGRHKQEPSRSRRPAQAVSNRNRRSKIRLASDARIEGQTLQFATVPEQAASRI